MVLIKGRIFIPFNFHLTPYWIHKNFKSTTPQLIKCTWRKGMLVGLNTWKEIIMWLLTNLLSNTSHTTKENYFWNAKTSTYHLHIIALSAIILLGTLMYPPCRSSSRRLWYLVTSLNVLQLKYIVSSIMSIWIWTTFVFTT